MKKKEWERPLPLTHRDERPSPAFVLYELKRQTREQPQQLPSPHEMLREQLGQNRPANSMQEQQAGESEHFETLVEFPQYQPTGENLRKYKPRR